VLARGKERLKGGSCVASHVPVHPGPRTGPPVPGAAIAPPPGPPLSGRRR
jgi:hypothetical protein